MIMRVKTVNVLVELVQKRSVSGSGLGISELFFLFFEFYFSTFFNHFC